MIEKREVFIIVSYLSLEYDGILLSNLYVRKYQITFLIGWNCDIPKLCRIGIYVIKTDGTIGIDSCRKFR